MIAEQFGSDAAFRMSLNFGVALKQPGVVEAAFFNFLGGKIVEYARESGIPVPYYTVMTNLVKELDTAYSAS